MSKRKSISKKIRFEVFKRDSFQCQYCGKSSPDVVLNVDHIKPVAKGGDNDITNLITACFDCNAGKSDRELSDKTVIEKQRAQLDELNEKRIQLEMMLEWREGLQDINKTSVKAVVDAIAAFSRYIPNETGEKTVLKWIKKYSLSDILDAVDTSFDSYLVCDDSDAGVTPESWNKAFSYVPRIINSKQRQKEKPYLKDLYYIRGILNNRLNYVNQHMTMDLLEQAHLAGAQIEALMNFSKEVTSWSRFKEEAQNFIDKYGDIE